MKKIEKHVLMNRVFANAQSVSQPGRRGDSEFAGDDAYENPVCVASVGAEADAWVGEDAYETNEWHDLGGEA